MGTVNLPRCQFADIRLVLTRPKSNMNALFAATASKIKTRRNATKIACTSGGTAGHAQRFISRVMTKHSTRAQTALVKLTHVAIAAKNSSAAVVLVARVTQPNRTGTTGSAISKRFTSSENAIRARSFSVLTTSDNISSTVTQAQAVNGPTCSRLLV